MKLLGEAGPVRCSSSPVLLWETLNLRFFLFFFLNKRSLCARKVRVATSCRPHSSERFTARSLHRRLSEWLFPNATLSTSAGHSGSTLLKQKASPGGATLRASVITALFLSFLSSSCASSPRPRPHPSWDHGELQRGRHELADVAGHPAGPGRSHRGPEQHQRTCR